MGFLSYHLNFYRKELQKLTDTPATQDSLYHARQLLRMLDDLVDEGYTELNERIEKEFCGISRLREYLSRNHVKPFHAAGNRLHVRNLSYSIRETELNRSVLQAVCDAKKLPAVSLLPFANKLRRFCQWIGYDDKTAYIFLLRDTLLRARQTTYLSVAAQPKISGRAYRAEKCGR